MKGRYFLKLTLFLTTACVIFACGDNSTDQYGAFDIYGRIVNRPPEIGSSAEFYLYHDGEPAGDAIILVRNDTIPLAVASQGYYSKQMTIDLGDTLAYSVDSQWGTSSGTVIIPDTAEIIRPLQLDTLLYGSDFTARWREVFTGDGYFAYLQNQSGLVAAVGETRIDTSTTFRGYDIVYGGSDNFWVEVLSGLVVRGVTPDGRTMPKGIFGAAANYREVYISLSR